MSKSKIQWTDVTDNPIRLETGGHWCKKISPGCAKCYAETANQSDYFWWSSKLPYTGKAPDNLFLDEELLRSWSRMKKPKKHFVCSMTDWCGDWVPMEWQLKMLQSMSNAPSQTFQLLTKRSERFNATIKHLSDLKLDWASHLSNVWFGVSVEDQKRADERIEVLAYTPAAIRFLSIEPLLGEIDLTSVEGIDRIHWVIVGGESGKGARECYLEWIHRIVLDCQQLKIPVFVKQLGSNPMYMSHYQMVRFSEPAELKVKRKGGDWDDPAFPEHLKIREFPI
jgi:protein gp37